MTLNQMLFGIGKEWGWGDVGGRTVKEMGRKEREDHPRSC